MANIIEMPKLSDTMTVGTLVKWLKKEGDAVKAGDMLAEVETDKATMELESFFDGTLLKIFTAAGRKARRKGRCPGSFHAASGRTGRRRRQRSRRFPAGPGSGPSLHGRPSARRFFPRRPGPGARFIRETFRRNGRARGGSVRPRQDFPPRAETRGRKGH